MTEAARRRTRARIRLKLLTRYPDGFDSEKSIHRKEYENA